MTPCCISTARNDAGECICRLLKTPMVSTKYLCHLLETEARSFLLSPSPNIHSTEYRMHIPCTVQALDRDPQLETAIGIHLPERYRLTIARGGIFIWENPSRT